ncbi:MAG: hypothetical protein ACKO0Z_12940 [Betaproteobacteria bacterium]
MTDKERMARLEKFAQWALNVAEGNHLDAGLAFRRIAEEARAALSK